MFGFVDVDFGTVLGCWIARSAESEAGGGGWVDGRIFGFEGAEVAVRGVG